jgi:hypothetical protein
MSRGTVVDEGGCVSLPDEPSDDSAQPTEGVQQSEQERLQAAEFLVATRVQEQVRRRVARAAMDVRDRKRGELAEAIHQPPAN